MPFSSSPTLDDMTEQAGTTIGGVSQDAHRQEQLDAIRQREEAEVARQQRAKEMCAAEEQRKEQARRDREAASRKRARDFGANCITVIVFGGLLYLAIDAYRNRRDTSSQRASTAS